MKQPDRYRILIQSQHRATRDPAGYHILSADSDIREVEDTMREKLRKRGQPEDWAEVGIVFEDQYIQVIRDAVEFPNGQRGTYIRVATRSSGAVGAAIFPVSPAGVCLVRHFRHATRSWHLEIPRGMAEPGESMEATAARELTEETGMVADRVEPLGHVFPDNGILADRVELVFAAVSSSSVRSERHEAISSVIVLSVPELEEKIASGEITDSFTMVAFARARLRKMI